MHHINMTKLTNAITNGRGVVKTPKKQWRCGDGELQTDRKTLSMNEKSSKSSIKEDLPGLPQSAPYQPGSHLQASCRSEHRSSGPSGSNTGLGNPLASPGSSLALRPLQQEGKKASRHSPLCVHSRRPCYPATAMMCLTQHATILPVM